MLLTTFRRGIRVSKRRMALCAFLLLSGALVVLNSLSNPRLNSIHGSDRLQLIAAGLLIGTGIGFLLGACRFQGE
jgi:hypothetical protein